MKESEQGFILLTTLILISVMSLLLLSRMQDVLLYTKMVSQQIIQHQAFYELEFALMKLTKIPIAQLPPQCISKPNEADGILPRLERGEGCHFAVHAKNFVYQIEDLGEHPCLQTFTGAGTHHWLYTMGNSEKGNSSRALQLRIITSGKVSSCLKAIKIIKTGLGSWRYIRKL